MTTSVELVLLKCLQCGTPVPAEEDEVAWRCATCGQGLQLTETGLAPLAVHWAAARGSARQWHPFWVLQGQARFLQHDSYSGRSEPHKLWQAPRRFYVPAFSCELELLEQLGAELTLKQAPLEPGPAAGELKGCTLLPADARQAADFIVLTIEADRKNKVRTLRFSLDLSEPELWLLPFSGEPAVGTLALARD